MTLRFFGKIKNRRMAVAIIVFFVGMFAMLVVEFLVYFTGPAYFT